MQEYIKPMLPAELSRPFDNEEWLFEKNYGGFRAIAVKSEGKVHIYANKSQLLNQDFPEIVSEFSNFPSDFVIDGEIVVLDESGWPDPERLIRYHDYKNQPVRFLAFDLLQVEGQSLLRTPLMNRKEFLKKVLPPDTLQVQFLNFVTGNGCDLYRSAILEDIEGITAKNIHGVYRPGKISSDWLKVRVRKGQEIHLHGLIQPHIVHKKTGSVIAEQTEIKHAHDK